MIINPLSLAQPKMLKANRRLSARLTGWAKGFGKKEQSTTPKDEISKESAEPNIVESSPIADEAPRLEQPVLAEPIKIGELSEAAVCLYRADTNRRRQSESSAPATTPQVSATA